MTQIKENSSRGKNLVEIINELLLGLNDKEKRALSGRFGFSGKKETLSAIGHELNLSRERVRQIEKNALRKLSQAFCQNSGQKIKEIEQVLANSGGVIVDENIPKELLELVDHQKFAKSYLRLIWTISPNVEKIDENENFKNGWRLTKISKEKILALCTKIVDYFKKSELPDDLEGLKREISAIASYENEFILSCIAISKKLVIAKNGMIGLSSWPSVNPRNVRDKIYYVLKTTGQPMHFTEITSGITALEFDKKRVVRATVHNELIADRRFVLIGRGIYALREWGYSDGTVYEVIKNILRNSKVPMMASEIIDLVNKSRKVKKNTIVINLQTKKEFKKVGRGYVFEKL